MKERPILFSDAMVRAILDGRKTQTRRVMKPQPTTVDESGQWYGRNPESLQNRPCPYGQPGDRLWVREAFAVQPELWAINHGPQPIHFLADSPKEQIEDYVGKPSIHMPRWASRILLEITNVRVERVQDISNYDAKQEGVPDGVSPRAEFVWLWNSINTARGYGWDVKPWVWVIEFRRITT